MPRTYPEVFEEGIELAGPAIGDPPGVTWVLVERKALSGGGDWWYAFKKGDAEHAIYFLFVPVGTL